MRAAFIIACALVGYAEGLSPSTKEPTRVASTDPTSVVSSRRAWVGAMATLSASSLLPVTAATAFDNKISNKYDDRPKRRGPKVRRISHGVLLCRL